MVITLYLMGREVITFGVDLNAGMQDEQVTRTIGFAAAELSEHYEDLDRGGFGRATH